MFKNNPGETPDQKFKKIEEEFSLENIHAEILTEFPEATQRTFIFLVNNSGLWLQVNFAGSRYRSQLTAF